jgi:pimeloyl-ACP methyl ester carboxylesterase
MGSFRHHGSEIAYEVHGEGDRVLVLIHGLLMNRHMYAGLAPEMAARGNRVVTVDLLGHGESDAPPDMRLYGMHAFSDQVAGLLDALGLGQAVIGGTSLGANVSLAFANRYPERARGLFIEMPVLENGLLGAALAFTPILVALRFGQPILRLVSTAANFVPRTHYLADILLDWARRDPVCSRAVLEGVLYGPTAPGHEDRERIEQPALVIGHRADPLHPFSDAGILAEELPNARLVDANSILEWRLSPARLNDELARFLDDVYAEPIAVSAEHPAAAAEA